MLLAVAELVNIVRPSVRPSVCLCVKPVICDKTKEICVLIVIPYEKPLKLSFLRKNNGQWGEPLYLEFWVNGPSWREIANFQSIFSRIASALATSKKFNQH